MSDASSDRDENSLYRVLARKYRPKTFDDLVGQEALVRTLTNAIDTGRLAHAFILTGVRGVGKTTTARIIARALNCIGPDGKGEPTPSPCGLCDQCVAIAQDRHVDVIEMDAASRTGVADIRELIEGVRYRPVQARYKIYIIDEVHMLSNSAFNALLKTLEEPPEHVVFIFATTEIRKVPVTVLSRCQRFDLRRLTQDDLQGLFSGIAAKENVTVEDEALAMIGRAADGSARDGLSLLDQAIALGGGKEVRAEQVQAMLGLADRARIFDLFAAVVRGKVPDSLDILGDLYAAGADPAVVMQDLLELAHFLTRAKLVPATLEAPGLPETERLRGRELSESLSLASLARIWQMLLKGLGEVQTAPIPLQAAEMALIRLAYASDLPSPAELVQRLTGEGAAAGSPAASPAGTGASQAAGSAAGPDASATPSAPPPVAAAVERSLPVSDAAPQAALAQPLVEAFDPQIQPQSQTEDAAPPSPAKDQPESFAAAVALVRAQRETILANHLMEDVHLVRFEPGRIEICVHDAAPPNLASRFAAALEKACDSRWIISISQEPGETTLREQEREEEAGKRAAVLEDPLVKSALEVFPEAELVARRDKALPDETTGGDEQGEQEA
ncbi:DNA polymerase III subunit gamma/tau [Pelagibius litoralis]|uniref:DNA polymerase III subunit gamma/tau n=1 Tax=Pelagibius litoralis TaxID=374515 RepID=A0A967KHH9_9PROT|nr:DNA polymerase III subunit gamma/tau [Pelagibius litoralis]NIA71296.1 DNA polymerase III subunit gamma/tau [Pelagibius litoralis]